MRESQNLRCYWMRKVIEETIPPGVAPDIQTRKFTDGKWQEVILSVPKELPFTIYIKGVELVTILCSPTKLNCLVLGYLYYEGIIKDLKDVVSMRVCEDDAMADVILVKSDFALPQKKVQTSGCGGGISFNTKSPKIDSDTRVSPQTILRLMSLLVESASSYNLSGGIHTSALCDSSGILALAEDIGRHNTLDKLIGECLLRKMPTSGKILLASGRVSSEMIRKAAVMQTPVIASLTSPTERAVLLARELGISLVGYARGNHLTVYSRPERLEEAAT
jgi:FdhD protein